MTDYINGRVKWFDIKKGYGFIQSCHDEKDEYFIHHVRISTDMQFSSLFDGEYVSFRVIEENGKTLADDVKGISRGPLLCESRRQKRDHRESYKKEQAQEQEDVSQETDNETS